MDEFSSVLGAYINLITIEDAFKKKTFIQSLNNYKWVLIIKAVFALSQLIQPLIIFKGKYPQLT